MWLVHLINDADSLQIKFLLALLSWLGTHAHAHTHTHRGTFTGFDVNDPKYLKLTSDLK